MDFGEGILIDPCNPVVKSLKNKKYPIKGFAACKKIVAELEQGSIEARSQGFLISVFPYVLLYSVSYLPLPPSFKQNTSFSLEIHIQKNIASCRMISIRCSSEI